MNYAIIIPARFESTRLPGKPLVDLCGVPMVVRTYRQCTKACPPEKIYVATDDEKVAKTCVQYGMQFLMTSNTCLTGTDRVAECISQINADIFINVQGDEPVFDPKDILKLINAAKKYPGEILNGFCEITDENQFRSDSVPKVVTRLDGRLLYISRSPIPSTKNHKFIKSWRQVCAYVFPRQSLEVFSKKKSKTTLEQIEDIEILRFLELGFEIRMIELSNLSVAVDLPEDVSHVVSIIRERGL